MHELANSFSTVNQISCILQKILNERDIAEYDLRKMMNLLLNNKDLKNIDSFLSAFLTGILFVDLSSDDIASLVDEILSKDKYIPYENDFKNIQNIICVAGSGKKYHKTFNVTTLAAILASGLGAKVVKTVSKGVTSKLGSGELLDTLKISAYNRLDDIYNQLNQQDICFVSIEQNIPTFDSIYGGRQLTISPLSYVLPGLMSPIKCQHIYYGLSSSEHLKSLELFRKYGVPGNISVACSYYYGGFIDELIIGSNSKLSIMNSDNKINVMDISEQISDKTDPMNITSFSKEKRNVEYILQTIDSGIINDYTKIVALNSAGILITANVFSDLMEAYRASLNYIKNLKLSNRIKMLQK
ncbi:hypothetical protein [Streptococcus gallolyticus]|uniref:hypothetical protein n=1 Tax=Streptococcus gallolyticus TaxID=315405 RepID=UPI0022848631|nr:hypothetical protein [Streptococcus gallolyticus]MCY7191595.1 hypothetical protein [Streptococcus gallolyticus subsp. gallolyticus]